MAETAAGWLGSREPNPKDAPCFTLTKCAHEHLNSSGQRRCAGLLIYARAHAGHSVGGFQIW